MSDANDAIDLRVITRKLLAKWWWFLISVALCLAVGAAYYKTTPKTWMVQAVMLMGDKSRTNYGGDQEDFIKGTSYLRGRVDLEDKVAVLTSKTNMARTLRRLDFGISYFETKDLLTTEKYEYPPFFVVLDTLAVQVIDLPIKVDVDRDAGTYHVKAKGRNVRLYNVANQEVLDEYMEDYEVDQVARIGDPFVAQNLSFSIEFPADREYRSDSEYHFVISCLDDLVARYREKTKAEPLGKESNIVVLRIEGEAPEKEINFLNKLMESYIESELNKQQLKGLTTIRFIDEQIGNVSDSLRRAESSIEGFRASSGGVINVATTSEALFQERSRLEDERSLLTRRRNYCASVLEKIRSTSDLRNVPAPSSSGIDDPVLNNLVIEITRLSADLAAQNLSTGARSNPTVIAMERRIKNLTASLAQTAESLVEQAEMSLVDVNRRISSINYQSSQLPSDERRLVSYERRFKLSDNLYNYLMEKRAEAGIAIASDQVDKVVVDDARVEGLKPISPDKRIVLGGSLLLGLILPVLLILLRDFFNDRIVDLEHLTRLSKIPILTTIPSSKRKRIQLNDPKSRLAEAFRTARINLQYLNRDVERQVVGFTSSTSGEGKTFCAVNLAIVMALSGKRTLLVDADLRRPNLLNTMGMQSEGPGLSTYLIGECDIEAMIRNTEVEGLSVIDAGPVPPNPLELMESERLATLIKELRTRYDQIVIDASPLGLVSEYVIIMRHIDVNLYVVRQGRTGRGALRLINEMVDGGKITNVDLLLNDVRGSQNEGYGYYAV